MDIFQVILCGNVLRIVASGSLQMMHPRSQIGNGGHAQAPNAVCSRYPQHKLFMDVLPQVFSRRLDFP